MMMEFECKSRYRGNNNRNYGYREKVSPHPATGRDTPAQPPKKMLLSVLIVANKENGSPGWKTRLSG
jgi:hypothetical protein